MTLTEIWALALTRQLWQCAVVEESTQGPRHQGRVRYLLSRSALNGHQCLGQRGCPLTGVMCNNLYFPADLSHMEAQKVSQLAAQQRGKALPALALK